MVKKCNKSSVPLNRDKHPTAYTHQFTLNHLVI